MIGSFLTTLAAILMLYAHGALLVPRAHGLPAPREHGALHAPRERDASLAPRERDVLHAPGEQRASLASISGNFTERALALSSSAVRTDTDAGLGEGTRSENLDEEQSARLARLPRVEGLHIPSGRTASAHLDGIVLQQLDGTDPQGELLFEAQRGDTTDLQLELGAPMTWRIVLFPPNPALRFCVEQQYETSLAVGDEGPHLDLLDWKHYTSEWTPLSTIAPLQYATREVRSAEFPSVTREELEAAVRAAAREGDPSGERAAVERWGALARSCESPETAPCYVGVSLIRWRISIENPPEEGAPQEGATPKNDATPKKGVAPKEAVAPNNGVAPKEGVGPKEAVVPQESTSTPNRLVVQVLELRVPLGC